MTCPHRPTVDVTTCPSPHSRRNQLGRLAWGAVWTLLFRPSLRPLHGWRRMLLRAFGARVGEGARIDPAARIWAPWNLELGPYSCLGPHVDCYSVAQVRLGAHATVSQYAFLCTASHDHEDPGMRLFSEPIAIGAGAWVCACAFVGPGVTVGEGAVLGARAAAFRDVEAWTIALGTPARSVGPRVLRSGGPA